MQPWCTVLLTPVPCLWFAWIKQLIAYEHWTHFLIPTLPKILQLKLVKITKGFIPHISVILNEEATSKLLFAHAQTWQQFLICSIKNCFANVNIKCYKTITCWIHVLYVQGGKTWVAKNYQLILNVIDHAWYTYRTIFWQRLSTLLQISQNMIA